MPPSSSAPKKGAGKSRGGGGKESKGQIVLVLLLMTICVAIYHFRGIVFSFVLPKFVIKPRTGEGNGAVLGGEFELMGWANYLEKIGQGQDAARCCYSGTVGGGTSCSIRSKGGVRNRSPGQGLCEEDKQEDEPTS